MAKKRGGSPLGNALGSAEAQQAAAQANLNSLTRQLSNELEKSGHSPAEYLQKQLVSNLSAKVWHGNSRLVSLRHLAK